MKLTGVNLAGDYTITIVKNAPHLAAAEAFIKFLLGSKGQAAMKADHFRIVSPAKVIGLRRPKRTREPLNTPDRWQQAPRSLRWLGALLILYLGYPLAAFAVRVVTGIERGLARHRAVVGACWSRW